MSNENFIWRGIQFWSSEIEKAGAGDNLRFFNDVVTETRSPHPDAGYQEPVLTDVVLGGRQASNRFPCTRKLCYCFRRVN